MRLPIVTACVLTLSACAGGNTARESRDTSPSLRLLPPRSVPSLQYFSAGSAEARFGAGHLLGAIEVITAPH
jgi:hypothetical protein